MPIIEELALGLGWKVDNRPLDDARRKGAQSAKGVESSFRSSAQGVSKSFKRMAAGVAGAFAAIKLGGFFKDLVFSQAEAADATAKLSKQLGVASKDLQRLQFSGQRSGATVENVNKGIQTLTKNLFEATQKGTGPAAEGLELLGLEAQSFFGLGVERQFELLSDALVDVADKQTRSAIAGKLFGEESGPKLLELLNQGSEGIRALGDEAERYGGVLSDEVLGQSEQFQDSMLNLKTRVHGAGAAIAGQLIPVVDDVAQRTAVWLDANQNFIQQDLPDFLGRLVEVMGFLIDKFATFISLMNRASEGVEEFLASSVRALSLEGSETAKAQAILDRPEHQQSASVRGIRKIGESTERFEQRKRAQLTKSQRGDGPAPLPFGVPQTSAFTARAAAQRRRFSGAEVKETDAEKALAEALTQVRLSGLEKDLRELGVGAHASEKAIDSALKAAAGKVAQGASKKVARKAGVSQLSGLTGTDLSGPQGDDATLAAILGDRALPDVPIGDLTRQSQPQVLISTINNTYSVSVTNQIDGAADPKRVAESVSDQFRRVLSDELSSASKMSKVVFAR